MWDVAQQEGQSDYFLINACLRVFSSIIKILLIYHIFSYI